MSTGSNHFITTWWRGLSVATVVFIVGSFLITGIDDQFTPRKELFYSWLLVFFNAYIGTFIANQALKGGTTGFYVWAFLINGLRTALFLVLLLSIVKLDVLNIRGFVLSTFFGYFTFLVAEISGLQAHLNKISTRAAVRQKND